MILLANLQMVKIANQRACKIVRLVGRDREASWLQVVSGDVASCTLLIWATGLVVR